MTFLILLIGFVGGVGLVAVLFWYKRKRKRRLAIAADGNAEERSLRMEQSDQSPADQSLRDTVTGLYNRKHLLERLKENMAWCDRKKEKMAVVLWDIDGFTDFTNRFGQQEGDRLLKRVAETVRRSIRIYDEAFRSGPDEFSSILVPSDDKIARDVTSRVANLVEVDLFEEEPTYADQKFSISSGLVFYPGESSVPEALLHAARQELYKSRLARVE